jgi:hypothetical protein
MATAERNPNTGACYAEPTEGPQQASKDATKAPVAEKTFSEEEQKMGERLHPRVKEYLCSTGSSDEHAGKIIGMLLDGVTMKDLEWLLENPKDFAAKVDEAIKVLRESNDVKDLWTSAECHAYWTPERTAAQQAANVVQQTSNAFQEIIAQLGTELQAARETAATQATELQKLKDELRAAQADAAAAKAELRALKTAAQANAATKLQPLVRGFLTRAAVGKERAAAAEAERRAELKAKMRAAIEAIRARCAAKNYASSYKHFWTNLYVLCGIIHKLFESPSDEDAVEFNLPEDGYEFHHNLATETRRDGTFPHYMRAGDRCVELSQFAVLVPLFYATNALGPCERIKTPVFDLKNGGTRVRFVNGLYRLLAAFGCHVSGRFNNITVEGHPAIFATPEELEKFVRLVWNLFLTYEKEHPTEYKYERRPKSIRSIRQGGGAKPSSRKSRSSGRKSSGPVGAGGAKPRLPTLEDHVVKDRCDQRTDAGSGGGGAAPDERWTEVERKNRHGKKKTTNICRYGNGCRNRNRKCMRLHYDLCMSGTGCWNPTCKRKHYCTNKAGNPVGDNIPYAERQTALWERHLDTDDKLPTERMAKARKKQAEYLKEGKIDKPTYKELAKWLNEHDAAASAADAEPASDDDSAADAEPASDDDSAAAAAEPAATDAWN